ncbi:hypothetical protein BC628DRAFT_1374040 [Trametes gibbosa]|nr:hypothetical protein BC628DRAFT_1374040 [Trametes gibbosa]
MATTLLPPAALPLPITTTTITTTTTTSGRCFMFAHIFTPLDVFAFATAPLERLCLPSLPPAPPQPDPSPSHDRMELPARRWPPPPWCLPTATPDVYTSCPSVYRAPARTHCPSEASIIMH